MNKHRGVTLIEVLIAILVLAVGLLGIAKLQSSALANNLISYQATQASTLADGMIERMRGNRQAVINGDYDLAAGAVPANPPKNCASVTCSSTEQAQWDIATLYLELAGGSLGNVPDGPRALLPSGRLSITCASTCIDNSIRLVTVYWDASRNGANKTDCTDVFDELRCFRLAYVP